MPRHNSIISLVFASLALTICVPATFAARPSASLVPNTTKGYLSVEDVDELRKKWNETQLGHLMKDPVMEPFVKDIRKQMKSKANNAGVRLGITLDDLEGVYGGEVCIAAIQPNNNAKLHAMAILVDATGHIEKAQQLLAKVSKNLTAKGGKKTIITVGDIQVTSFTMPKEADRPEATQSFYVIHEDQLIATDHEQVCRGILARFKGEHKDTLENVAAYTESMDRCEQAMGQMKPHVRWFVEPFGMIEVSRAASSGRRRRGTDLLKVLSNQGFRAIQGLGGHIVFATGEHEIVHHTYVHAPGPFGLAARMLDFPTSRQMTAKDWIPRDGALHLTFNWKMKEAFEHSKTLVDEIAGDKIFEEVLKSIKHDPNGPQIDIRKELVAHLSERATLVTNYRLPITPKSERYMLALELTDAMTVSRTIDRAMEHDPEAIKREFNGHVIWEIINDDDDEPVALDVDGGPPGFGQFGDPDPPADEKEKKTLPNSAVTVAHGHLIIASHVDYIRDVLTLPQASERLSAAVDYKVVNDALNKLGAGEDSFRVFVRTDEAYRPNYELIRQGKMPESETMVGKFLNNLLGPEEEDVMREQQIDGSQMPDYQVVRRYLGPTGTFIQTEKNGWFVSGCFLNKEVELTAKR